MKHTKIFLAFLLCVILSASTTEKKITVFTIGDSTCANKPLANNNLERGWGQALQSFFDANHIIVDNHALNGRSSLSFRNEGNWKKVYDKIKPGDFVFIQFGHNDEKPDSARHTEPGSTYNQQLARYIDETREKGGIPVLLTSIVRRKFNEQGTLDETHGNYIQSVRDVAKEKKVLLIDHNEMSKELVQSMGPEDSKALFMWVEKGTNPAAPDGRQDDTHLRARGARAMARLVVSKIKESIPELAKYVTEYDLVVAKDGSGDFMTVQEAINAVPANRSKRTTIFIRQGVYKEKLVIPENSKDISFIGEDINETKITYDDFASKKTIFGENIGTFGSSSVFIYGSGFSAENMTFENSSGPVGQAVAVMVAGDKVVFRKCRFLGFQDTLYNWGKKVRQYFEDCYIEGTVDFIFGSSTAVFNRCEIRAIGSGYLTAASTIQDEGYGYVFIDCNLTAKDSVSSYLGRPWRPYAKTVYINCEMGSHINPEGWNNWGKAENEKTAFYAEYKSKGPGADKSKRVPWSKQLTKDEAKAYKPENILKGSDGWNPLGN